MAAPAARKGARTGETPAGTATLREIACLRFGAGARVARADPRGTKPRHPERNRARLRVRDTPAPARPAGGDACRLPRRDPRRAPRPPRCAAAEARPLPGDQGGVLPRGLRARSSGASTASTRRRCSLSCARRRTCRSTTGTATRSSPASSSGSAATSPCTPSCCLERPSSASRFAASASPSLHVPEHAVDAPSLVALADLTVSAGGTMNREAAALGTPAYTTFTGQLGAVDEQLIAPGSTAPARLDGRTRRPQARRRRGSAFGAIRAPARRSPQAGSDRQPGNVRSPAFDMSTGKGGFACESSRRGCARAAASRRSLRRPQTQRQSGVQDCQAPMIDPVAAGRPTTPIISVGDRLAGGYLFESIPDGISLPRERQRHGRPLRQPRDVHRSVPLQRHDRCRLQRLHNSLSASCG